MIHELTIKNFQSHTDTQLDLAPFTVLVGASSVGKSAVARSLKALASNPPGKAYITHGESTMQIQARTDRGTITLTKGKPEDSYVILEDGNKNERRYTKLGGTVNEDITRFLGIEPKDAINFAGQFDAPYLLRSSAAEVARTLGELTNVSVVFEAAREATRRRNAAAATLKTRETDQAAMEPRLAAFENLEARSAAQTRAEAALEAAQGHQERLGRLNSLLMTVRTARTRLKNAEAELVDLPDLSPVLVLAERRTRLNLILHTMSQAKTGRERAQSTIAQLDAEILTLESEYVTLLHEAGTCPTCGQNTEQVGNVHA